MTSGLLRAARLAAIGLVSLVHVLVLVDGRSFGAAAVAVDFAACPASGAAADVADIAILASPRAPRAGEPLRIVAATMRDLDGTLVVERAGGMGTVAEAERRGAGPYWWSADIEAAEPGTYRVALGRGRDVVACTTVAVGSGAAPRRARPAGAVWPVEREWDGGSEALYSAWVEQLFTDPLDAEPSWRGIGAVLKDPERNLLLDHLGLGEDSGGKMVLNPDCADLPFFLRAYFAWKLGLPFGYSACSRGTASSPPRCSGWHSNLDPETAGQSKDELSGFLQFARRDVGWGVHSGTARVPAADDATDLYPVRIATDTIRPGTVFADPYGHTLVVVGRVPQSADTGGLLLAVDAQPDLTVARKRFWRGNFLFSVDPKLGGAGFKNFRPIVATSGKLRRVSNEEIERDGPGDVSMEQYVDGVDGFYDRMDAMLSPEPRDPRRAMVETIDALEEQVGARVRSVNNGEEYVAKNKGTIAMPEGAAIFETTGAWEDFATPSRDLRLLIAIDVVRGFPERVARQPDRFVLAPGETADGVRRALEKVLDEELAQRSVTYRRSDGSEWRLTLADVVARAPALEMAYNPNDCVELRWGASKGGDEAATCRRGAPPEQRARMERYREWFADRRRPPRQ